MRLKGIIFLISVFVAASPCFAQNQFKLIEQVASNSSRAMSNVSAEVGKNTLQTARMAVDNLPKQTVPLNKPGTQLTISFGEETSRISSGVTQTPQVAAALQQNIADAKARAEDSSRTLHPLPSVSSGVFQVRNLVPADGQLTYSGTVIRDQNEVYGVVAAHILRGADNNTRHLTRTFVTDIWTPKGYRSAVVKPVFVASGIDLALIKFSPQVETLLEAVELETQFPQVGQTLISQGFINDKEVVTLARTVTEVTPLSIRTTMPWPREKRTGLCGSSVKNMDGKIIGIHIGSSRKMANEQEDIGYIVPAWQLRKMIEAYHNEDVTVPFVVDGEIVFEMHADEYISQIVLLDEYGQSLERLNPSLGLPSQQLMRKLLHTPLLQRMEITFGRRYYNTPEALILTDEPNVRTATYDVAQQTISH